MKISATVCLSIGALFLIGCSLDSIEIIDHPKKIGKGEQFDATLCASFWHITNGTVTTQDIIRDSVHLAIGIPESWTAVSAKYYVANNFKLAALASKLQDSVEFYKAIAESAAVFKARAVALTPDVQFSASLGGRTYSAKDRENENPLIVATNSIGTWSAYSGAANILITKGTTVDTVVKDSTGTMGVIIVPVFLWATMKSRTGDAIDTLFYLAKTAAMPQDTGDTDKGDMKYVPIAVGNASPVAFGGISYPLSRFSVRFKPSAGNVVVTLGPLAREADGLGVYDLSGSLVKNLTGALRCSQGEVRWDASADRVKAGTYIVRMKANGRTAVQPVRIVR